ncbi:MAG: two-component system, sensor histidine kinase and response regulator [Blastocatellia bacterium]
MGRGSILVVEDTPDILDVVCLLLEQEGYSVYNAECCSRAFDVLANHEVDLIITDLMLPEMTGLEFIHKVRRVMNYDFIPVVAMSAFDHKYLAAAAQAGAVKILHKPEDLDLLVPTVNQLLRDNANRFNQSAFASS